MLTTPRFAPEDFERLQNEALDYLTKTLRGGNDEELGKWTLQLALYPDHPYGHVDRGTVAGLKAITLDDVKAFHQRALHARGACTSASPAASIGPFVDELERRPRLARGRGPAAAAAARARDAPKGLEVTIVEKPADCDGDLARVSRSTSPAATTISTPWPSPTRTSASTGRSTAS